MSIHYQIRPVIAGDGIHYEVWAKPLMFWIYKPEQESVHYEFVQTIKHSSIKDAKEWAVSNLGKRAYHAEYRP